MTEAELDYLEAQIPALAQAASTIAYWGALAAGCTVLVAENGAIYRVFPDGSRKFVQSIAPPTTVEKGKKIHFR
ncbi:MAG: hypothetical protein M3Y56_06110 [Armatimonadota bacterium]|nr:hypothetical protein [Armatimonadota bacterium]